MNVIQKILKVKDAQDTGNNMGKLVRNTETL